MSDNDCPYGNAAQWSQRIRNGLWVASPHEVPQTGDAGNVDLWVRTPEFQHFWCTVHSPVDIQELMGRWIETGERRAEYFCSTHCVIVPEVNQSRVVEAVDALYLTGELDGTMFFLPDEDETTP